MIFLKKHKQLDMIRRSCVLAAQTLFYLEQFVVPGCTTGKLDELAEEYILKHGAIPAPKGYKGYPKSICTSVNDVICHGIPDNYELKNGDIINIDVTTILNGYYGDTSRMYKVGTVTEEASRLINVAYDCMMVGIEQIRPGNYLGNIGYRINELAVKHGYSVVYQFCGHGTGIRFHECPQVFFIAKEDSGMKLREGMVFTCEPMINTGSPEAIIGNDHWTARTVDGKLSAQWEHTVVVTNAGYEVLTNVL